MLKRMNTNIRIFNASLETPKAAKYKPTKRQINNLDHIIVHYFPVFHLRVRLMDSSWKGPRERTDVTIRERLS